MNISLFKSELSDDLKIVESKLKQRRLNISADTSHLIQTIALRVTSPKVLLAVAGVGFIVGELTKTRPVIQTTQANNGETNHVKTKTKPVTTPLREAGRYAALAYSALNSWPVITLISMLKENSKQKKTKKSPQAPYPESPKSQGNYEFSL